MQRAVERDSENRSNYAMCAVNPSRVSKTFTDAALRKVVHSLTTSTGTRLYAILSMSCLFSCPGSTTPNLRRVSSFPL
ncbi:hypothetical protein K438DRAFT_1630418 [Mycena galopus ATCC 62051]|nr:hypothetical protein K438DRAFT_1630418 [Mycena galopus ATCC 62051]